MLNTNSTFPLGLLLAGFAFSAGNLGIGQITFVDSFLSSMEAKAQDSCHQELIRSKVTIGSLSAKGWSLVETKDLHEEDRILWANKHGAKCPGVINFSKEQGSPYMAFTLLKRVIDGKRHAKLLRISLDKGRPEIIVISNEPVSNYPVIYMAENGVYSHYYDKDKQVTISKNGIIFEHMEATATLYYWDEQGMRSLLISD